MGRLHIYNILLKIFAVKGAVSKHKVDLNAKPTLGLLRFYQNLQNEPDIADDKGYNHGRS